MITLDLNNGEPPYMVGFDSVDDTANIVPDALGYLFGRSRAVVIALAEYRGWKILQDKP
ncbi:MAG: hypothetical protein U1E51_27260 [Candidatus Binatia bacterium]|nr:hypothetical protein [Candidatus Binatia bacterium]